MQILSLNFLIYTLGGVWRPNEWSSNGAKLLYSMFTFCSVASVYFWLFTQFMDTVFVFDNVDNFVKNAIFINIVAVCCKATVAVTRRNAILDLVQMLLKEPCKPQDEDEIAVQIKYDEFIRLWSIRYSILTTCSLTSIAIGSVLNVMQGNLPYYRGWLPYDINISLMFWITSIQQMLSLIFATIITTGTETLVFGFILQTCAQLEIFESRLHKLIVNKTARQSIVSTIFNKEESVISEYIRYHLVIYKYAKTLNNTFNQVLFIQFFGSILILCAYAYYLSTHIMEIKTAIFLVCTVCMFVQTYVYCWSGNEVILKSTSVGNAIYHMDWTSLSNTEKKDLLMIMKRSTIPIKFTSSFLITLSLQCYVNMLKISYSAFNVLRSQTIK